MIAGDTSFTCIYAHAHASSSSGSRPSRRNSTGNGRWWPITITAGGGGRVRLLLALALGWSVPRWHHRNRRWCCHCLGHRSVCGSIFLSPPGTTTIMSLFILLLLLLVLGLLHDGSPGWNGMTIETCPLSRCCTSSGNTGRRRRMGGHDTARIVIAVAILGGRAYCCSSNSDRCWGISRRRCNPCWRRRRCRRRCCLSCRSAVRPIRPVTGAHSGLRRLVGLDTAPATVLIGQSSFVRPPQ
mmetsp:Transcript_5330/g.7906  ORF Transcript_5330/g.7906 Transcript_5330/m.7906 type:complete len:241 (+) Transcript_5330:2591-3313(+)